MKNRRIHLFLGMMLPILLVVAALTAAGGTMAANAPQSNFETTNYAVTGLTDGEAPEAAPRASHRLIVELASPPLARWSADTGISRLAGDRLDAKSTQALAYVAQLEAEQAAFVSTMQGALPEASVARYLNEAGQAKGHLKIALENLSDPNQIKMCKDEIDRLEGD